MKTLIVVHASVGSGHQSAANSIAQTAERLAREGDPLLPGDLRVVVLDILDFGWMPLDGDLTTSSFTGTFKPFYDITWRYSLTGHLNWAGGTIWSRLMFKRFTEYVRSVEPIAIVSTHIVAANAAVAARMITGFDFPIVCVPTDFEAEGLWPHLTADLFCAASESMAETLRPRRVEEERILVTGIPTRDAFLKEYDSIAMRDEWHLPQNKMVALVLAGARLPRPYIHFREAIDTALPQLVRESGLHIVLVAGKDEEYAERVRARCRNLKASNVTVLGYVEEIAELMAASDVVICKSGGLSVSEGLNAKKPMILVGRAYGQERINVRTLTSMGAAMHAITGRELVYALKFMQRTPALLDSIVLNGEPLRNPYSAVDIVHATMLLANGEIPPIPKTREKHFMKFYWGGKPAHNR